MYLFRCIQRYAGASFLLLICSNNFIVSFSWFIWPQFLKRVNDNKQTLWDERIEYFAPTKHQNKILNMEFFSISKLTYRYIRLNSRFECTSKCLHSQPFQVLIILFPILLVRLNISDKLQSSCSIYSIRHGDVSFQNIILNVKRRANPFGVDIPVALREI